MLSVNDIQIRDPFVLTVPEEGCYYLYGTTDEDPWSGRAQGFRAYKSRDLENWEGPYTVFTPPPDFWADRNFWAPEVHRYRGAYYMPASFKSAEHRRAVHILWSRNPLGPFLPLSPEPVTPEGWECLDGTLYWDETDSPWLIFSHEWTLSLIHILSNPVWDMSVQNGHVPNRIGHVPLHNFIIHRKSQACNVGTDTL